MITVKTFKAAFILFLLAIAATTSRAEDLQVGRFVQLRGNTTIQRGVLQLPAQIKGGILANDTITTASASRAKLLFIDDSVLTMSDNTKMVISEFIHSKTGQGRSVFNLLDGKMRSVVGKTKLEVHTPTAVAAARGTVIYFEVGTTNNQVYSKIICLEGTVQIRNATATVVGEVTLTPGTMVVVKAKEPPPLPVPTPQTELDRARQSTQSSSSGSEGSTTTGTAPASDITSSSGTSATGTIDSSTSSTAVTAPVSPQLPSTPPIQQQPIVQPRKVNINIGIPGQ